MDYFTQFSFLQGHFLGHQNYWGFRNRYFWTDHMGWEWSPRLGTIETIKQELKLRAFVLTRKEAGIGSRKVYEQRHVEMTPSQRRIYKRAEKEFLLELPKEERLTNWNVVKLNWMQRIAGGFASEQDKVVFSERKVQELVSLLTGELVKEQVVVWFRFNRELENAAFRLTGQDVSIVSIKGSTLLSNRKSRLQKFARGDARVLLAQVKCAKFGLDCSAASTAIYYSNGYDYEDRVQSEDRIIHPKKVEPVLYIDLITRDSVDENVVEVLREKHVNARVFMTHLMDSIRARTDGST